MVRRAKFADGSPKPLPKPERSFQDKLKTLKNVSQGISPESRIRLLDYFIQEALTKGQLTEQQASGIYNQLQLDKDKIREQIDTYERENFSDGGMDFSGLSVPQLRLLYRRYTGVDGPSDSRQLIRELKRLIKGLDEDGIPFSEGGAVEREDFYKGSSLEPQLDKIKELFLKGKTDREIAEIIKQPRGTVSGAINSMKDGSAPVKISTTELSNRPAPVGSNIAKSQEATNRINKVYEELTQKLGKPPTRSQLVEAANVVPGTIRSNTPNLKFTSEADAGAKATAEMYKKQKVDKPTRTTYAGVKGAKFKNAAQEAEYKKFLELAAEYPKGSPKNPYDKKFFAKKFNMPETDVESIHKVVREKYNINYPKATDTSAGIRAAQLREKSDTGLEQEYTKLKKGERIGNPDLAHRVSKKYNVTTANLGLDNPLINRVIVKPNERDISKLYDQRIKIENKYKLKDGTFKKPSNADIKILEKINNDVETLARETKGRLSAVINDPTDLNKPYGSLGVDPSKTIGGGIIDVDLKDVKKLSPEDQAFLKLNLLELKKRELNKTPKMIADEFKDVLSKPAVRKRIENIIGKGKMETPYIKQSKQILALSATPNLTTADQLPIPQKTKTRDMFKKAFTTGAKTAGKIIKPLGVGFGVNAVKTAITKAEEQGLELSNIDKLMAFDSGDAEVALNNARRRVDPVFAAQERAKDLAQMTDDFEEVGQSPFGKYNDQIKNIKLP
jgi:hypothetical protein